eukprot:evm.model.scf_622.3 EVM.evm.TU.scf_622.3   scf_622:50045-57270(+)
MALPRRHLWALALLLTVAHADCGRSSYPDDLGQTAGARRLHQESAEFLSNGNVQETLEATGEGNVVLLGFEVLDLEETVEISTRGITLRGTPPSTTFRCPKGKPALSISAPSVVIEKVKFENCDTSAVVIANPDAGSNSSAYMAVSFSDVEFVNNGALLGVNNASDPDTPDTSEGGAISAGPRCAIDARDCKFSNNAAAVGGAVHVRDGSLSLTSCVFLENVAQFSGGAVFVQDADERSPSARLNATDCQFSRNAVTTLLDSPSGPSNSQGGPLEGSRFKNFPTPTSGGGAVFAHSLSSVDVRDCTFEANRGGAGGAIYSRSVGDLLINQSTFERNTLIGNGAQQELRQGGAVYALLDRRGHAARVVGCDFADNEAAYGGALHLFTTPDNRVAVTGCRFERNGAELYGGAALLRNAFTSTWEECEFESNEATVGGAVMLTNGAGAFFSAIRVNESSSRSSSFVKNTATFGGAIMCLGCGVLELQSVAFSSNEAGEDGGALAVHKSLTSGSVAMISCQFSGNGARRGGAIFFRGGAQLDLRSSPAEAPLTFDANRAVAGGAIFMIMGGQIRGSLNVADVVFSQNSAIRTAKGDRRRLLGVQREAMAAGSDGRGLSQSTTSFLRFVGLGTGELGHCGEGGGSAMCLDMASDPEDFDVQVAFLGTVFEGNVAEGKGTLKVSINGNGFGSEFCPSPIPLIETCKSFTMRGTIFKDNTVASGEPTVSTNDADAIFVTCGEGLLGPVQSLADLREGCMGQCPEWTGNESGTKTR